MELTPFHLAVRVRCLDEALSFYGGALGFGTGRCSDEWIDFNMFGHQLVTHLDPTMGRHGRISLMENTVDSHSVPVPHFGVVLKMSDWLALRDRLRGVIREFVVTPYVRFQGQPGEQATMFFLDPSGNALEFKGFRDIDRELFETARKQPG